MTDSADESLLDPGDSRRRIPYLGRALLVTVLLILVAVGLTVGIRSRRQQALIREIKRSGGRVYTEFTGPDWLKGLISDNNGDVSLKAFQRVLEVDVKGEQCTGPMLKRLVTYRSLGSLSLHETQITDDGLVHLKGMTTLWALEFEDCPNITDRGLEHIAGLTNLQWFLLNGCPNITDSGLVHLNRMTNLTVFSLQNCPNISDAGLEHLKVLTNLREMRFKNCERITGTGLVHLQAMTNLGSLWLQSCPNLADSGLAGR